MRSASRLTLLRFLLALGVVVLAGACLGAALSSFIPVFTLFEAFAAHFAALAAIGVVLSLLLRMPIWAIASLALALWQGALVLPFVWPATETSVSGTPLRVLSLNLWRNNPDPEKTIDYLLASDADVIGLVEVTPEWQERLDALKVIYPYRVDCRFGSFRCWTELFSKQPILNSSEESARPEPPIIVWAKIDWQGKPLTIGALQISNPMIGLERGLQAQLGESLRRHVSQFQGDTILMGDFNSAPWSTLQSGFRTHTGFDNRYRLAFTWPSWAPAFLRLPIDQIFVSKALAVRNYKAGPSVASDHLPVLAEIYRTSP